MNGRPVTDAQISQALRAHLPNAAAPGLRERVFDATATTAQVRPFPSFLGALSDADPVSRRRSLLIAAALLLALAVASAAAVGAWRLLQRDPIDELSLEPPADVPAFVLSSYERLPQLPPVALTWRGSDSTKGRVYVDHSGAVRFDRFATADATEPSGYRILSPNHRISGTATVDSEAVWVEQGHEAIDVPREYIRGVLGAGETGPGCEMERDPSEVGNGTAAAGWRYVGLEYVAGRPTHHVACVGDLWIDIETRLILRTQGPAVDDAGQAIPVEFTEVTEIAFGEPPAALFEPPEGVTHMSEDEYSAYICARDLPNELFPGISDCPTEEAEATPLPEPSPEPEPSPTPTVPSNTSECPVPPGDPSPPIGPLAWTPERLNEDWPAPVRAEPPRGGSVRPMLPTYHDATSDNESDAYPCVDIRWVMADTSEVQLKLVSKPPPWSCSEGACFGVDPTEQWIAYGIVTDEDGDGVPDWRYGIDNMPADLADHGPPHRGWRTNLHTGQTEAGPEHWEKVWQNSGGFNGGLRTESADWEPDAIFQFGGVIETTQGSQGWGFELDMPFYTWASVIVNGRVVATDYSPDSGWLVATPGVALVPNQPPKFPGGTYLLEELPIDLGWEDGGSLPLRVSMTVPHNWTVGGPWGDGDTTSLAIGVVGHPLDGCPDTIEPKAGPTFDDLVSYFEAWPRIDISEIRYGTLDGYRAAYLEYRPADGHFDCMSGSVIPLEPGNNEAWILDVDGVRLMIAASSEEAPSETAEAELRQIVESIQIEP